jgi:hypothetical protein
VKRDFKIISVLILIMLIVYFYMAVDNAHKKSDEEGHRILSDAIIRSAVQCYAIEGFYPPGIEYLENNYGLLVDHDKYFVRAPSSMWLPHNRLIQQLFHHYQRLTVVL